MTFSPTLATVSKRPARPGKAATVQSPSDPQDPGGRHPDRDAQFTQIARRAAQYQAVGDPVISVDTKKKELVGDFKNGGQEWHPKGEPEEVRVYDFIDPGLGKVRALRRLRCRRQSRVGQRWDRSRHGRIRRRKHPALVERKWVIHAIPRPAAC